MLKNLEKYSRDVQFALLIALIAFLPLSSWLVSLTGRPSLSLIRDILVLLIFLVAIIKYSFVILGLDPGIHDSKSISRFPTKLGMTIIILTFILYGLLSYLWREDSPMQWLRGFRLTFIPFILLLTVGNLTLKQKQKNILIWTVLVGGLFIALISILELIGIKIPLTTTLSGNYGLEVAQYVQGDGERRLQSLLAGPNALGLYMLALVAYTLGLFKSIDKKPIWPIALFSLILILTFSRSSLIGLIVILIFVGATFLCKKIGVVKSIATLIFALIILTTLGLGLSKSDRYSRFITHGTSSSLRTIQYQRIWDTRGEIGLLGRGMGTAGPSSQNRLDGGPNHWTENIYLDIFEELGYIGLILYLILLGSLLCYSSKNYHTPEGKTAFLINIGFAISGLFINIYTGQVGIYLLFIANGLLINSTKKEQYGKNTD